MSIVKISEKNDTNYEGVEILERGNNNIQYIAHMADIHIHRTTDIQIEYMKVFDELMNNLKKAKLNNSNSVIVVCGDIVNDKLELSDISIELLGYFFTKLCEITTTIVILGNHDVSLKNTKRNSLSGLCDIAKTKNNLFLLRESGLYEYHNIIFGHTRFGENIEVQQCKIKTNKIKIGLYHGTIHNSSDDSGNKYQNTNTDKKYLNVADFKDYDFCFLGDIHKQQFFGKKKNIAYSGSLIQQNVSESLDKGYILWNLKNNRGIFKTIHNDYGKIKININTKGKYEPINFKNMPKNINVCVECQSLKRADIDKLYNTIESKGIHIVEKNDYMVNKIMKLNTVIKTKENEIDISLIKNTVEIENIIIAKIKEDIDIIKKNTNIDNVDIDAILKLLRNFLKDEKIKNEIDLNKHNSLSKKINLISLSYDNMSVYGKDNNISFDELNGIVGICGKNSEGKSSFIDCILQSIYGICTRGNRRDMINNNANSYKSEIILTVNNITYKIKRNA